MVYDKTLIDSDFDEYPYSESISTKGYHYRISIEFNEKHGELSVISTGTDIRFDDGSFLDFNVAPKGIFPGQEKLSEEDLLNLLEHLSSEGLKNRRKFYSKEQFQRIRADFAEYSKPKD